MHRKKKICKRNKGGESNLSSTTGQVSKPIEAASPRNSIAATPKSSKGEEEQVATPCEEEEEGEKSRPPSSPAPETGLPRPHIPSAGAILAQVSKIDVGVQTEQVRDGSFVWLHIANVI